MKATISYKGLTVEIEGTPEEIAQYTDTLSKELNQPPDSTARATIIWQIPIWYQQFYDNCLPKWVNPLYSTMGSGLI